MLNYYAEVERFDREVGEILSFLEKKGTLDNTLIVVTSDNGMPFPRAKATLYDAGSRMPMVMAWKNRLREPKVVTTFVNLIDLAPTFLKAAEVSIPPEMEGKDLFDIIDGKAKNRENVSLSGKDMLTSGRAMPAIRYALFAIRIFYMSKILIRSVACR